MGTACSAPASVDEPRHSGVLQKRISTRSAVPRITLLTRYGPAASKVFVGTVVERKRGGPPHAAPPSRIQAGKPRSPGRAAVRRPDTPGIIHCRESPRRVYDRAPMASKKPQPEGPVEVPELI